MSKHTPGPWEARKTGYDGHASGAWYILAPKGPDARSPSVAHVKQSTIHPMEANARLIAAAPAMLEALEESLRELLYLNVRPDGDQKNGHTGGVIGRVRAALKAAKGEA